MSIRCSLVIYKYCALNASLCSRSNGNSFDQIEPYQLTLGDCAQMREKQLCSVPVNLKPNTFVCTLRCLRVLRCMHRLTDLHDLHYLLQSLHHAIGSSLWEAASPVYACVLML